MTTVAGFIQASPGNYLLDLTHLTKAQAFAMGMEDVWALCERLGFGTNLPSLYACATLGLVEGFLITRRRARFFRPTNEEALRAFAAAKLLSPHKSAARLAEDLFGPTQPPSKQPGSR